MPSKYPMVSSSEDTLRNITPKALNLACEEATAEWKNDLQALFHDAKNRFPDIVWTTSDQKEAVWGHKAMVYARNSKVPVHTDPPSRAFSFSFRSVHPPMRTFNLVNEGVHRTGLDEPYPSLQDSPKPAGIAGDKHVEFISPKSDAEWKVTVLESPSSQADLTKEILSFYTVDSGPPSTETHTVLHITAPAVVTANLDIQKSNEDDQHEGRLKLFRKDLMTSLYRENLIAVWKDKLHTDIQVSVPWFGQEAIKHRETSVYRFSTHRSILVSRSPVLRNVLMGKAVQSTLITLKMTDTGSVQMALPYPPFTPSSFYYVLGYMYSGTIDFRPDREFSLNTAFSIVRSSIFLSMPTLQKLVVAHIVVKMAHGLFHAYLSNAEYLRLVGASWSRMLRTGGCKCNNCMIRVPRVLQFALGSNVHSYVLQRGARRALIGMFGLGWCSHEFASIQRTIRVSILSNVIKMVTPENALALLFAAQKGLDKLDETEHWQPWDITVRAMILTVCENVDEELCKESRACFDSEEWRSIISMDTPTRKDQLELIMMTVLRATQAQQSLYITSVYQTFDSLEIPDTPGNFFVRAIVEHIKCELLSNMGPMLSSSAISSISLSTHFSFVTAEEEFDDNASRPELSHLHPSNHRHRTTSIISKSERRSLRTRSSASSIYSDISYQTVPWSIAQSHLDVDGLSPWSFDGAGPGSDADVEWDDSRSEISRVLALDLANPSTYSRASSRTLSTDYGLFYTRHALSDGSMSTLRRMRRRNSWDSLISVY